MGKTPIAGVKDRATDEVRAMVVSSVNTVTLQDFVGIHMDEEAELFTDEHSPSQGMPNHTTISDWVS